VGAGTGAGLSDGDGGHGPHGRDPRVAILTDDPGWHGRRLVAAFAGVGVEAVFVSLADCHLEIAGAPPTVWIPGFAGRLPRGVFVRGVPGGTLEAVILRLDCLHALEALGVLVYNSGRAVERTVDKALTSFLLAVAGLPTPPTWICASQAEAAARVALECHGGGRLVLKPLFGSQGEGVRLVSSLVDLPPPEEVQGGVYYLQRFVEGRESGRWRDYRVFVVGGRAVAAMRRASHHWITNRAQGAICEAVPLASPLPELAEAAARAVNVAYAGVDLLRGPDGTYWVGEVNGVPAWMGLEEATGYPMAQALVAHFNSLLAPELRPAGLRI